MKYVYYCMLLVVIALCVGCDRTPEVAKYTLQEDSLFVISAYDKSEQYIEMRDGTKLFTAIYSPKDKSVDYPIILFRTPYSIAPYGTAPEHYKTSLGPSSLFLRDKYIFVYQDVRGAYMSEGIFENMRPHRPVKNSPEEIDENSDTFDTIEWLISNIENNNGKVGQWGISYPGFYTSAGMIDSHPALVAASPQAPIADWWYDDFHHHGAFFLAHSFNFLANFSRPKSEPSPIRNNRFDHGTQDGYQFFTNLGPLKNAKERYFGDTILFWNDLVAHPNYDQFWKERDILPHLKNINCAVLTVGGWFDAEDLYGPLETYKKVEKENPTIFNALVMGPWHHGAWARNAGSSLGNVHFGGNTSDFYNEKILFPFFLHYLKDKPYHNLPEAYVFETGTNEWKEFDQWPPQNRQLRGLYFQKGGRLSFQAPLQNEYGMDVFESDPADPVPFTEATAIGMTREYMTDDQWFAARRDDVLTYETEPLVEPITLAGGVNAKLFVATTQTDADWIVKVIDVYPETHPPFPHQPNKTMSNYQQIVRSEVIRGRYRESPEVPKPFEPGKVVEINLPLQDVLHTFKTGHKIMVQVQSTWFPLVDRNPQKFVDNIFLADESDFVKATHRVYRSGVAASHIQVPVLMPEKNL